MPQISATATDGGAGGGGGGGGGLSVRNSRLCRIFAATPAAFLRLPVGRVVRPAASIGLAASGGVAAFLRHPDLDRRPAAARNRRSSSAVAAVGWSAPGRRW